MVAGAAALIADPPFPLTSTDIAVLNQEDDDYVRHDWINLRYHIHTYTLDKLKRIPTDLVNYIHFCNDIKKSYGSITPFLLKEKLQWVPRDTPNEKVAEYLPLTPKNTTPFVDGEDLKIMRNDWPYGCVPGIGHVVVWLKTRPDLTEDGDPSPTYHAQIEEFVNKTFRNRMEGEDKVMWFRNRTQWQSVRSLEHVHVLLRDVPDDLVREWTGQKRVDMEVNKWKDGKKIDPSH